MEIEKIKEEFEKGNIDQEDMDFETQKAIAELYRKEIQSRMDRIIRVREENKRILERIKELDQIKKEVNEELNKKSEEV